jgi:CHU_C Type IX secretion signal domain
MKRYLYSLLLTLFFPSVASIAQTPCSTEYLDLMPTAEITASSQRYHEHELLKSCRKIGVSEVYTAQEASPWWQARLSAPAQIEGIRIEYSAADYPEGLKDFYIFSSSWPIEFTGLEALLNTAALQHIYVADGIQSGSLISLGRTKARYVRIQAAKPSALSFAKITILGNTDRVERPGNGADDDCDGLVDAADPDLAPVFRSVLTVGPSCPECNDGAIHVVAGGNELSISLDGGQSFRPMPGESATIPAAPGSYNLVLSSRTGGTTQYDRGLVNIPPPEPPIAFLSCKNGNFANNFTGWTGGQGDHNETVVTYPIDPLTGAPNTLISAPRQQIIQSGSGNDPNVGTSIPLTSPSGQGQFARLGNTSSGNDDTQILTYRFTVNPANVNFSFWFATVMWRHSTTSDVAVEPFFTWSISSPAGAISSGTFNPRNNTLQQVGTSELFFHPWECVQQNLAAFMGQQITVRFESAGCGQGGHGGYAYIDGLCASPSAASLFVSDFTCGTNSVINAGVLGGSGFTGYFWRVEKLDANGNPIPGQTATGPTLTAAPIAPLQNILNFWKTLTNGTVNCDDKFRVTLTLVGGCGNSSVSSNDIFQVRCSNSTLNYCDIAACNGAPANIQTSATGSCPGCTFQWTPAANLSSPTAMLPTVANPGALGTTYQVLITSPNTCTATQTLEVWDAALAGTLSGAVKCVDKCAVKVEAYFLTTKTLDLNRITVTGATSNGSPSALAFTFTQVQNLANGVKKYTFTSQTFENKGTGGGGNTPVNYTLTIKTTTPAGFCNSGNCPSSVTATLSVPRGLFHGLAQYYIPNVFSPNSQNPANQIFNPFFNTGDAVYGGVYWIKMEIFDRWGGLVYRNTLDLNPTCSTTAGLVGNESGFPWNGRWNNTGAYVEGGPYVYIIQYKSCTHPNDPVIISGDVLVLF